jgi:hypothetical protein
MAGSPQHATLVADTVTTFTFDEDYNSVEAFNVDGAERVYFTVDGTDPDIAATGSEVLPAAIGGLVVDVPVSGVTVVKLKSVGVPAVSVRGLNPQG